MKLLG
jgi:hypothetical protein